MNRHGVYTALLWVVLTAIGEWWAVTVNLLPIEAAEEAAIIDEAFNLLMILAVPVAALVLALLFYSVIRFRSSGETTEDGPPIRSNRPIVLIWVLVSTALAVAIVFNPGIKGIRELAANPNADMVVQIEGSQWHWKVTYPDYGLTYDQAMQIALPVDTRVKFEISSRDVVHSVWIPAMRMKMDAVPGKTTVMYVTPTQVGSFEDDPTLRVQCAELCGTGHPLMRMGVRVLEPDEFQEWIDEAKMMGMAGQ
jgi:cytochrome c oxidase subunit 2